MRSVYKYKLDISDLQTIKMPRYAKIVHTGFQWGNDEQDHQICLWAEVDSEYMDDLEDRRFDVVFTGDIILRDDAFYVGTVQMPSNMWGQVFVWHVYEVPLT
jgi:hypothetical protein